MQVRILGPLEVWDDGRAVDIGTGRRRAVFVLLTLRANEVVSSDRLIDELWGDAAPPTAAKALQNHVSHLRKALGPASGALVTQAPGYRLQLHDDELDAWVFEQLVSEGRRQLAADPARASERLSHALALWRGAPLAEFQYERFAQPEIARLEELWLGAVEDRTDADLASGAGRELVPELEALVAGHPLRERLRGALMLALYRSGRQTEALEVYRDGRQRLHDELGLEPGVEIRQLEQAILRQDPELGAPEATPAAASAAVGVARRNRGLAMAAVCAAVVGVALVAFLLLRPDSAPTVVANSLVRLDAESGRVLQVVRDVDDPGQVEIVGDYVFVAGSDDGILTRVDRLSGEVATTGRYDATGGLAAMGDRGLWVVSSRGNVVTRIDAETLREISSIPIPANLTFAFAEVGGGSLWVSQWPPSALSRYNLRTQQLIRRYAFSDGEYAAEVAYGSGAAWLALATAPALVSLDNHSGAETRIPTASWTGDPDVGFDSVWTVLPDRGTLVRIDPITESVQTTTQVGRAPWGVATGAGSVWVTDHCEGVLRRIDPATGRVVSTTKIGLFPQYAAAAGNDIWVGVAGQPVFPDACA
jgi:DNA-binding SARP family transcriptional activator/streptogramin lyase